jgi:hypothetical protein
MDVNISERLQKLIELKGLNKNSFSIKTGVSAMAIGHIIGPRKTMPGLEIVQKICKTFPDISVEWLVMGNGPMIKQIEIELPKEEKDMRAYLLKRVKQLEAENIRLSRSHLKVQAK